MTNHDTKNGIFAFSGGAYEQLNDGAVADHLRRAGWSVAPPGSPEAHQGCPPYGSHADGCPDYEVSLSELLGMN